MLGVYKSLHLKACFAIIEVIKRWRIFRCGLMVNMMTLAIDSGYTSNYALIKATLGAENL